MTRRDHGSARYDRTLLFFARRSFRGGSALRLKYDAKGTIFILKKGSYIVSVKRLVILILLGAGIFRAADFTLQPSDREMDSILASVNGEPIALHDIIGSTRAREYQLYNSLSGKELERAIVKLRKEAVDRLIDEKLLIEDYRKSDFKIPNSDVESELDAAAENFGVRSRLEFSEKLRQSGSSLAEFRSQLEEHMFVQLMLFRRYSSEVAVSPRDVYEYYQAHPDEFLRPETFDLAMIMLSPDREDLQTAVEDVRTILEKSPDRFGELALRYSSGPEGNNGGRIGTIERKRLRQEFADAIVDPVPGKCYGPIQTRDGIAFLKIEAHKNAVETAFEQVSPAIRRKLDTQMREAVRKRYLESLRREAVIRYFFPE